MTIKQMFLSLTGFGVPSGDVKAKMFEVYNSKVGSSIYAPRTENPQTHCGSCIQRVKAAVWKMYHSNEVKQYPKELEFRNKLGIHNQPLYKLINK